MLLVLADDFSGAAEIAGIGYRYGLRTEIQLRLDLTSTAELIVLDTDTRSLNESESIKKISEVGLHLKDAGLSIRLFKKIDSVMRGHLIPEVNALQDRLGFDRILILPANPTRGRKIISGQYFINETRLHETAFNQDPDFPATTAHVGTIINRYPCALEHVHVTAGDVLPAASLITADIASKADLKNYVAKSGQTDLCVGAAELFEAYLENLGYVPQDSISLNVKYGMPSVALIINGSTVKNPQEKEWFDRFDIPQISFPDVFHAGDFVLPQQSLQEWYQEILSALHSYQIAAISIDHPVQQNKDVSKIFLNYFVELMHYINSHLNMNTIHFCLTGGATASAVIRNLEGDSLFVTKEIAPGVVSLVMIKDAVQRGLFTVKPGSYSWPVPFIKSLLSNRTNS